LLEQVRGGTVAAATVTQQQEVASG
jgi:hypothetical protein